MATVSAIFETWQLVNGERERKVVEQAKSGGGPIDDYGQLSALGVGLEEALKGCQLEIELSQGTTELLVPFLTKRLMASVGTQAASSGANEPMTPVDETEDKGGLD